MTKKYNTIDELVNAIIEYYNDIKYPNHNIDIDLQGFMESIFQGVYCNESDYKTWYDEEKDEDCDNMDMFFNYEYVKDYIEMMSIDELEEYID